MRLEAKGRLTKRFTASRSLYKSKYKGNLDNFDSSVHSLSTATSRGLFKPNLQFTYTDDTRRIGAFSIKA